jgi:7-cyano-7-deazaguanine synthase
MKNAVVLLSGGLDSSTVLALARRDGFDLFALTMSYGQRHREELAAASRIALQLGVRQHVVLPIDLRVFGGSSLTSALAVPKRRQVEDMQSGIPATYVPARNTVFLSFALAWAEVVGAADIFVGVNAVDYSGYPDCRPEYIAAFERMANLATKAAVEGRRLTIHAPLIRMTKAEIIRTGLALGVDYAETSTCYDPSPDGDACGECDACILRQKGFEENGMQDPRTFRRMRGRALPS